MSVFLGRLRRASPRARVEFLVAWVALLGGVALVVLAALLTHGLSVLAVVGTFIFIKALEA